MRIFLLIALLIALIAVIFALQNTQVVSINFLAWTFQSSIALEMIITLIAGVLVGILAMLPGSIRSQLQISSKKKEKASLEASLSQAQQQVAALQKQLDEVNKTTQAE
jgi:putative membrane protein